MSDAATDRRRLILVRHGQTEANVRRALSSAPPGGPLTELGRAQAAALATRLADEPIGAVYASAAVRAQETAAPIAVAHDLDVQVPDGLHEVGIGEREDRSDAESREMFAKVDAAWKRGELSAAMPGGESAAQLLERFLPVVDTIVEQVPDTAVVVSHGAAIRLVATALLGTSDAMRYVPNTGIVILGHGPDGWRLEHWDDAIPTPADVTAGAAE